MNPEGKKILKWTGIILGVFVVLMVIGHSGSNNSNTTATTNSQAHTTEVNTSSETKSEDATAASSDDDYVIDQINGAEPKDDNVMNYSVSGTSLKGFDGYKQLEYYNPGVEIDYDYMEKNGVCFIWTQCGESGTKGPKGSYSLTILVDGVNHDDIKKPMLEEFDQKVMSLNFGDNLVYANCYFFFKDTLGATDINDVMVAEMTKDTFRYGYVNKGVGKGDSFKATDRYLLIHSAADGKARRLTIGDTGFDKQENGEWN